VASRGRFAVLVTGLALFTVVAAVVIWFVWSQLTDVLEGHIDPGRDIAAVAGIGVLVWMMSWLGHRLR
jgi:hypothetical protein